MITLDIKKKKKREKDVTYMDNCVWSVPGGSTRTLLCEKKKIKKRTIIITMAWKSAKEEEKSA